MLHTHKTNPDMVCGACEEQKVLARAKVVKLPPSPVKMVKSKTGGYDVYL